MMLRGRRLLKTMATRWVGERAIPIGGTAHDRYLLRRALAGSSVGRVLVIGSGLATRQALPAARVDVAGTSPHAAEVTVCSSVQSVGSLPQERWDTVIITDPGRDLRERLRAVLPACRPAARLLVVDRGERAARGGQLLTIAEVASVEEMLIRRSHRLWVARIRS